MYKEAYVKAQEEKEEDEGKVCVDYRTDKKKNQKYSTNLCLI